MRKTYLDAFNPLLLGTDQGKELDKYLFYETLITNNHIVMSNDNILECLEYCGEFKKELFKLIKKRQITIVQDYVPVIFNKHEDEDVIIELTMNEPTDIEYFYSDKRYQSLDKLQKKCIENNSKILDYKLIDMTALCEYICKILNDKHMLVNIYKSTKPAHVLNDVLPNFEYEVTFKGGIFYFDTNIEDKKFLASILIQFFYTIIRTYINALSQISTNCDSLILSNSNRTVYEELSTSLMNSSVDNINCLLKVEKMPNISEYLRNKKLNFKDIIDLRYKGKNLRNFINNYDGNNTIDFYKEYRDRLEDEYGFLNNRYYKTVRLAMTSLIVPLGIIDNIGDVFGIDEETLLKKLVPTIRLQDVFNN